MGVGHRYYVRNWIATGNSIFITSNGVVVYFNFSFFTIYNEDTWSHVAETAERASLHDFNETLNVAKIRLVCFH